MLFLINTLESEQERLDFQEVYEENYRRMYYAALKILKNPQEAEDAVHSAFVKLAEKFRKYSKIPCSEMAGLCVIIVKNKALDMKRLSRSDRYCELEKAEYTLESVGKEPAAVMIRQEESAALLACMRELPEGLRLVLELRYFYEYSNGEIADILDISKKNVEVRLYRAKKKLKEVLLREGRGQTV